MNVFISGPALTSAKNMLSVWDWGGGRTPFFFCFCFEDFKLRIKNETQNIAINHNLWSWLFFYYYYFGRTVFFPTQRKWSMAFNIFFLSYTWQSVGFLFHVIHYGCFFAHVFLSSHWMTAHRGCWTLTPCVCLWTQAGHSDLPVQKGGYCIFSSLLSLGVAMLLPLEEKKKRHVHTAENMHVINTSPRWTVVFLWLLSLFLS